MLFRNSLWAKLGFFLIAALTPSLQPNGQLFAQDHPRERDSRRSEEERRKKEQREGDKLGKEDAKLDKDSDRIKKEGLGQESDKSLAKESGDDAKERERKAQQLEENRKNGAAWETKTEDYVRDREKLDKENLHTQVTIQGEDGTRSRADVIYMKPNGEYVLVEAKASETADYTKNQKEVFHQINEGDEVTVRGKGIPGKEGQNIRIAEVWVSRPDANGEPRLERYHSADVRAEE